MRRPCFLRRAVLLALTFVAIAAIVPSAWAFEISDARVFVGDDPAFADPDFDDSAWSPTPLDRAFGRDELAWVRARVVLEGPAPEASRPLGLLFMGLTAHEIYWDGERLGGSGVVGATPEAETPGQIASLYGLPPAASQPGEHRVAIRFSSHHTGFRPSGRFYGLYVADYARLAAAPHRWTTWVIACLGALVMAGLFFLVLGVVDRQRRADRLLGLLSLTAAGQLVAEAWRSLAPYTYDWHIVRLRAVAFLALLTGLLLVAFLNVSFRIPRGGLWLALVATIAVVGALLTPGYDAKTTWVLLVALAAAALLTAYGVRRRAQGSRLAALGIGICLLLLIQSPYGFLDFSLFYGEGALLLCLMGAHARQVREQRQAHEAARTSSLRLEMELLKRHLNPHFLMNSLTTLAELFEERPEIAGEAIEALAQEVRTLGRMSSRRQVTMAEEVALCEAHLAMMGFRRQRRFRLRLSKVDLERRVPPAIFHTLVENALTHNRYAEGEVVIQLEGKVEGNRITYVLTAPLGQDASRSEGDDEPARAGGLRYVEARLQESYGDDWSLVHGRRQGAWRTEIRVPRDDVERPR